MLRVPLGSGPGGACALLIVIKEEQYPVEFAARNASRSRTCLTHILCTSPAGR